MRMDLCPNCFETGYSGTCMRCGYKNQYDGQQSRNALAAGTVLQQRYYVGRLLGEGGFGITYKAYDLQQKAVCCVKEYAPNGMCRRQADHLHLELQSRECEAPYRAGLRRFLLEAQILSKLEQIPSVVDITDTFQENNTAYFVMEYLDGADLRQIVRASQGRLPVAQVTDIILQVAISMDVIHTKTRIIHRDISPENIYITRNGKVKLIDFGSAKQTETGMKAGLSVVLKPKFAPPEQFSSQMEQGSFTDVYSLAGTYYYALTGTNIPSAPDRLAGKSYVALKYMNLGIAEEISDAVDRALMLPVAQRTRTMQQFVAEIAAASRPETAPNQQLAEQQRRRQLAEQRKQQQIAEQRRQQLAEKRRQQQIEEQRRQQQIEEQRRQQQLAEQQRRQQLAEQQRFQQQLEEQRRRQQIAEQQRRQQIEDQQRSRRQPQQVAIPYVTVVQGIERGRHWNIPENRPLKVGRSEETNLHIRKPDSLSREHCIITYLADSKRFCIRDTSGNGVYYKGKRITKGMDYMVNPPARFTLASQDCVIELGVRYEYR